MPVESRAQRSIAILVVAPWARRLGGAEEMLWSFLRTFPRSTARVAVVFLEDGPFVEEVRALGINASVIPAGRLRSPRHLARTVYALARIIRHSDPDVVLNWMAKTQLYGAPAAVLSGRRPKVVWWQHLTPTGHWMDRLASALPASSIGASSRTSAEAQQALSPRRHVFFVHPGVDVPPPAEHPTRAQLGLDDQLPLVVLVGRLQPWKGQAQAIAAVAERREAGRDVQLLVVGGAAFGFDTGFRADLERLVDDLRVRDLVAFTGQVESAHPYLAAADIALNASAHEPFGIVLLEALASGTAVVAVDAGGPREIIDHEVTGLLAPDASPSAIAAQLDRLVGDDALRRALATSGRARYRASFTSSVMSRQIVEHLKP